MYRTRLKRKFFTSPAIGNRPSPEFLAEHPGMPSTARPSVQGLMAAESKLEEKPQKTAKEFQLENMISQMTGKPYIGRR